MSRGQQCKEMDELCAVVAIGEAINHISLDLWHNKPEVYKTYDQARNAVTEGMGFWLAHEFKKSKYYG